MQSAIVGAEKQRDRFHLHCWVLHRPGEICESCRRRFCDVLCDYDSGMHKAQESLKE